MTRTVIVTLLISTGFVFWGCSAHPKSKDRENEETRLLGLSRAKNGGAPTNISSLKLNDNLRLSEVTASSKVGEAGKPLNEALIALVEEQVSQTTYEYQDRKEDLTMSPSALAGAFAGVAAAAVGIVAEAISAGFKNEAEEYESAYTASFIADDFWIVSNNGSTQGNEAESNSVGGSVGGNKFPTYSHFALIRTSTKGKDAKPTLSTLFIFALRPADDGATFFIDPVLLLISHARAKVTGKGLAKIEVGLEIKGWWLDDSTPTTRVLGSTDNAMGISYDLDNFLTIRVWKPAKKAAKNDTKEERERLKAFPGIDLKELEHETYAVVHSVPAPDKKPGGTFKISLNVRSYDRDCVKDTLLKISKIVSQGKGPLADAVKKAIEAMGSDGGDPANLLVNVIQAADIQLKKLQNSKKEETRKLDEAKKKEKQANTEEEKKAIAEGIQKIEGEIVKIENEMKKIAGVRDDAKNSLNELLVPVE